MEFKLFNEGYRDNIVLIPGWAFDYTIFHNIKLNSNYIMPIQLSINNFNIDLIDFLRKNNINKISIFGWSMGIFIALDFISKYPEKVDKIIFVSAKEKYEKENIEKIKDYLRKNKDAYLYKFYSECFSKKEKEQMYWFKNNIMKYYFNKMDLSFLFEGLDYLVNAEMEFKILKELDVKFIHGKEDKIVPIGELIKIKSNLPEAEYILIDNAGHIPFLNRENILST